MAEKEAAFITGLVGISTLGGQLVDGWLADRVRGSLLPCVELPAARESAMR
jgi:hypothetical protein